MENMNNGAIVKVYAAVEKEMTPVVTVAKEIPTAVVNGLVASGKRGVTNAQMIPALRKFIEANDKESLNVLKEQFPAVYISSFKYLSKDQKAQHEALVNPPAVAEVVAEVIEQTIENEQPAESKELA